MEGLIAKFLEAIKESEVRTAESKVRTAESEVRTATRLDRSLARFKDELKRELVRAKRGSTEPSPPEATTEEDGVVHDDTADGLAPAATTANVFPELAVSAASAEPLDVDATGVVALTPTTCSTDGRGLDTDGDGSVDVVPELAAPVVYDAGHGVVAIDTTGLAVPTPVRRSTKGLAHKDDWVQPMPKLSNFSPTCAPPKVVYIDPAGPLRHMSPTVGAGHGVHAVDKSRSMSLSPVRTGIEQQPWPPPVPVQIAANDIVIFYGIARGCVTGDSGYVWWPPDHQSRMKSEVPLISSMQQSKSDDLRDATLSTMDYVIPRLDQSGKPLAANTLFCPRGWLFSEYHKVCLYWRIWDPGWMFYCAIILGSGDITWDLHQMILSTLKNSANTTVLLCFSCDAIDSAIVCSTGVSFQLVPYPVHRHVNLGCISASDLLQQAELANEYKHSVFSLILSISGSEIEYCSSMLSVFGESLLHLYSVLLLLPQPPPPAPPGLQSTGFFVREFKCELLRLRPAQTVHIVVEVGDSASSSFASVVLLFGHKLSMSEDLHFLAPKSNNSGLFLMASSTQNHFYPMLYLDQSGISCPFSTLAICMQQCLHNLYMLPCFPSGPISCEADHPGWDRELNAVCAPVVYLFEDYLRCVNLEMRQAWPPLIKVDSETASTIVYSAGMAYVDVADSETLSLSTYSLWSELPTVVIHMKQFNYKGLQSYSCYVLQLWEGTACLVHCNAAYEFYLAKFALVWKLDRCGSNNSALSVITSLVHSRNTCALGYILELSWRSQGLSMEQLQGETPSCDILVRTSSGSPKSYRSCACFPDNKCRLVVPLLSQSIGEHIGSIHKRGVETNAVKSTEFKSNISLYLSIHLVRSLSIPIELKLCADNSSSEIKRGLHPLYSSTIRVWMAVLFDWPLSSYREVFTGAINLTVAVTCMATVYSAVVTRNNMDKGSNALIAWLHILRFLSHVNSASVGATNRFEQLLELALCMSWDPGGRCDTAPIALHNKTRFRRDCCFDHAISEQKFVDHKYYVGFDIDPADNDYFLDISFDRVSIGNNYCDFNQDQEHREQWDLGGRRLEVKPSFKEGRMLGPLPNQPTYRGPVVRPTHRANTWA